MALFGGLAKHLNLGDLVDAVAALVNLGVTSTAAELDILSGVTASAAEINKLASLAATAADLESTSKLVDSITVVAANAAANTADVVITALDPDGVAIAVPTLLHVWITDLTTGVGGSTHTHSTPPAFTVGEAQVTMIAADSFLVLTTAAGTCTLRLLDTANENVTINAGVPGTGIRGSDTTVTTDFTP